MAQVLIATIRRSWGWAPRAITSCSRRASRLLAKLTSQQFDKAWHDLRPHDEVECQTVELAQWLAGRPTGEPAASDDGAAELPDFRGFVRNGAGIAKTTGPIIA